MRIVIALGGNALLRRSDPLTTQVQRENVRVAARAIAPLASQHSIVVVHGNGPQVGLLALQSAAYAGAEPYPLDLLDAGTQGMIGYLIQQELRGLLPAPIDVATLLTMVTVDPDDPAFERPTKFIGPGYDRAAAEELSRTKGWTLKEDGERWRRVVPSPTPRQILEIRSIRWLLERGTVVICAGGGGIPTAHPAGGADRLQGVEAVIDKDASAELLAEAVGADLFVMATDVDGVYLNWGTEDELRLRTVMPDELARHDFPAGSMGPKVEAAARFAVATGRRAAIGALDDIARIVSGQAGTSVVAPVGATLEAAGERG